MIRRRTSDRSIPRPINAGVAFAALSVLVVIAGACGSPTSDQSGSDQSGPDRSGSDQPSAQATEADETELFPDVLAVTSTRADDGSWTFSVTLSSPYDTPRRYADAWRVVGPDGEVYGVRELTHDHQAEQPFTRSQTGIVIPESVAEVVVEGRDQVSGWGGQTLRHRLER